MKTIVGIVTIFVLFACSGTALANQLHPVSGAYYTTAVDLKVAAHGVPMVWERTYRSNRTVMRIEGPEIYSYEYGEPPSGPLGFGWHSPFFMRIQKNAAIVSDPIYNTDALVDADGRYIFFPKSSGGIVPPDYANGYTLNSTTTGYTLTKYGGNTWTFDTTGRLLSIADSLGRTANLIYSGEILTSIVDASGRTVYSLTWEGGRVTKVTDLAGRGIQYEYDGAGNLASVKHDGDTVFRYGYNASHGLTSNSNAMGETWTVAYRFPPNQGIAATLTQPDGASITQQFDSRMSSVSIMSPGGISHTQTRNDDGQLVSEKDSTGAKTTSVAYLGGGVRVITDADGNIMKEYRDQWDNLTKRIDAEGGITLFSYNNQGNPTSITDAEGIITTMEYDGTGTLATQVTKASGTADATVTTYSYSPAGDLQSSSVDGASTTFTYSPAGLLLTITDPEGGGTTLTYDTVGNVTSSTDANGNQTEYSYDWRGNILTAKNGEGNITTYVYNAAGRLQRSTDPLGRVTSFSTDYNGKVTAITTPAETSNFDYDGNGNLKNVTRGEAVNTFTYDTQNRVTSQTDAEGNKTRYGYSNGGSCSSCGGVSANNTPTVITDPLGGVTTNTLDKLGRVKQISDPMNHATNLQYDKVGKIITKTDANGNATTYAYDGLGRVISQTDAEGGVTSFTYDKRGNLLTLTDPEGNVTTFVYDKAGRRVKETRPEGQSIIFSYYPNGLLKTVKDGKGQVTTYLYDKANRLTETQFADNTKHTFQYDKAGNMTFYGSPDVQGVLTYDSANRKTSEKITIGSVTKTYSYSYDSRGNKATFTSPEGVAYNYTYNKNDDPTQIGTPIGAIKLEYSWLRNTKVVFPSQMTTEYGYNQNNWITGITSPTYSATYDFDNVGNITQKGNGTISSYGYDKTYQLKSVVSQTRNENFTYDKVGNRKAVGTNPTVWSYNKNNELLVRGTVSLRYDLNGNTISKAEEGTTSIFEYNSQDRLATVQLPDGRTATYTYDPFGRRIRKKVGADTTIFVYADEGLIGEYSETGATKKAYGWIPNGMWGGEPVFQLENGNYYLYQNDHLGTPQRLVDVTGVIVWQATYEEFGFADISSDSKVINNLRFPGQYYDEETGLHYNWNRYYDAKTGRYIESDPLGFAGSDYNLYKYSLNNPLILYDNEGLATQFPRVDTRDCHYKKEYDSECMSKCVKDVALNKGLTSIPWVGEFIPSKLKYFDNDEELDGESVTWDGGTQVALNTAKKISEVKIDKLSQQSAQNLKYASRAGKSSKAMAAVKKAKKAQKVIKMLGPFAIIATAFDVAMLGNDINDCLSKCKLRRRRR